MPNLKISQLPALPSISGAYVFPVNNTDLGVTQLCSFTQLDARYSGGGSKLLGASTSSTNVVGTPISLSLAANALLNNKVITFYFSYNVVTTDGSNQYSVHFWIAGVDVFSVNTGPNSQFNASFKGIYNSTSKTIFFLTVTNLGVSSLVFDATVTQTVEIRIATKTGSPTNLLAACAVTLDA